MANETSEDERLLVIIPAWNEGTVIGDVLDEISRTLPRADVVVVSDGSTDDTVEQARNRCVTVIELPVNIGVGGAMRAGYLYAKRNGYDWAVQVDADGQHDPGGVRDLLDEAKSSGADVVIGARFAGKGDYKARGPRKWAMGLMSALLSPIAGTKLTDTTSGFKLNSKRAIELFSQEYPAEYLGDTIGALTLGAQEGLKIAQVPVEMRPRMGGEPSHGPFQSTRFLFKAWFALGVALTRRPRKKD